MAGCIICIGAFGVEFGWMACGSCRDVAELEELAEPEEAEELELGGGLLGAEVRVAVRVAGLADLDLVTVEDIC